MGQGNPGFPALQADRTRPQPVPSWSRLLISHLPLLSQLQVGRRPNMNQGGCVGVCSLNRKDRSVKILPQTLKKKKCVVEILGDYNRLAICTGVYSYLGSCLLLQKDTSETETSRSIALLLSISRAQPVCHIRSDSLVSSPNDLFWRHPYPCSPTPVLLTVEGGAT